ncbi:winged helix-turn-helix domain-containing protein [Pseudoclavibacter sp. RFBB5]|uniref:winged helix-turn-helix domain-containing protein n=1 Tax=Pseudoclavibacter sp. RFBB5 TaxID=2080574 RepID=UPI000CE85821|nr:winged helix-turn-helix domain-containing protein [Pseudoclavibacter sp. RFBB5]PPG29665.1 hypothetical protein C5B97_11895 [Pseudoclavibacter sp. RFBB5]
MSVKVSSWVWHDCEHQLAGNDLVLLLALADVADDSGRCRFVEAEKDLTYAALARKTRISDRTVLSVVKRLKSAGLIDHDPGAKGRPNGFTILVPWAKRKGEELSPKEAHSPKDAALFGETDDSHSSYRRNYVSTSVLDLKFKEFWDVYPRHVAKAKAFQAFEKVTKANGYDVVLDGARRFAQDPNLPDPQFIPHPASWLNSGRWEDDPLPPRVDPGPQRGYDDSDWLR